MRSVGSELLPIKNVPVLELIFDAHPRHEQCSWRWGVKHCLTELKVSECRK